MSSEQPRRMSRGPGGATGGSSAGSTVAIVIGVIAVVLAFLILRSIRNDDNAVRSPTNNTPATSSSAPGTTMPPTTTTPPLTTTGATVIVANAAQVKGAASTLTTALTTKAFTLGKPTDSAAPEKTLDATKIYYVPAVPAAKPVAESVARVMGVAAVAEMPPAVPVVGGKLETGASVLVMLGKDKASLPLDQMAGAAPAAPAAAAPAAPAGASGTSSTVRP